MRTLEINSLCGIKNQLYCSSQYISTIKKNGITDNYFDINSLFWSEIFDIKHVAEMVEFAKLELKNNESPKIQAVLQQPKLFIDTYINALEVLDGAFEEITPNRLFESLETLEILCHLHSRLYSAPFTLTLPEGYIHSKYSALDLENNCLQPFCNPYFEFINTQVIPAILEFHPDILILTGSPNIASFSIAKLIRMMMPNTFIIASKHESDYYSLQKISGLLLNNSAFFSVYHCVTLFSYPEIISQIELWYSNQAEYTLDNIPYIIYSLDCGKTIIKTPNNNFSSQSLNLNPLGRDSNYVHNMVAFPESHCYWNKCSFCGINSKYQNKSNYTWDVDKLIMQIKELSIHKISKIWFLDEAVPFGTLKSLAEQIVVQNISIIWHIRTRIEPLFNDYSLAHTLALAGLRHIIFGFESASSRILSLMEKNNGDFNYLTVSEEIVREFTHEGIQVHFSVIFGFPTETDDERNETKMFLTYLQNTYNFFSYNINPFYLDIGSKIYKKWESYNITSLSYPCSPKYFLENHLDWNSSIASDRMTAVHLEKNLIMKRQYDWYPEGALIKPSVFFAFWEFGRFSLMSKPCKYNSNSIDKKRTIAISSMVSRTQLGSKSWLFYHLCNHHYVIGGTILLKLIESEKQHINFGTFLMRYEGDYRKKADKLLKYMNQMDFFK